MYKSVCPPRDETYHCNLWGGYCDLNLKASTFVRHSFLLPLTVVEKTISFRLRFDKAVSQAYGMVTNRKKKVDVQILLYYYYELWEWWCLIRNRSQRDVLAVPRNLVRNTKKKYGFYIKALKYK